MKNRKLELILLVAIVTISSTLFMAARGAAIGVDTVDRYFWFIDAEIFGGLGLAVLESIALYYVAGAWYRLERSQLEWKILAIIMSLLLLMIPITSTPAIVAKQYAANVVEVLRWGHIATNHLSWLWTFVLVSVPSVMAFSIGVAGAIYNQLETGQSDEQKIYDGLLRHGADPAKIADHSGVSLAAVDARLGELQAAFELNGNGRKRMPY